MMRRHRHPYRNVAGTAQLRLFGAATGDSTIDAGQLTGAAVTRRRNPRRLEVGVSATTVLVVIVALMSTNSLSPTAQATSAWDSLEALLSAPSQPESLAGAAESPEAITATSMATSLEPTFAPTVFAHAHGIDLHLPAARPITVGFHEARGHRAVELTPVGQLTTNANARLVTAPRDQAGPAYIVMGSRGRPYAPLSAVDIAMHSDDVVLAPVNGTVTDVSAYLLYGRHSDMRVEIQPDGADELRVAVLHVRDVAVDTGDRVTAHETTIARQARRFAFSSQLDRHTTGMRVPHIHIEVLRPAR